MTTPIQPRNLEALDADPYDVCVIGSGFVGTIVARQMASKGRRVLMIESGRGVTDWVMGKDLKQLADYEVEGDCHYPTTRTTARAVGGNSNFWTGRAERFQPVDFTAGPYTDPACPWPVDYAELQPHYLAAEKMLNVAAGPFSEYMPPRQEPMPVPKASNIDDLKAIFADQQITIDDSPTAKPRKGLRFFRLPKETLAEVLETGRVQLVTGLTATRIVHDDDQRITHIVCRTADGQEKHARAAAFVLGCGGIQTPRLMLLSDSQRFPNGLGNDSGWLGRGFNEHPAVNIYAKMPHNRHTLVPRHKVGRTHQFYQRFFEQGLGGVHPVFIQSYLFPHHLVHYTASDAPKHVMKVLGRLAMATVYVGCQVEMVPQRDNAVTLSTTRKDRFGDPLPKLTFNYHPKDRQLLDEVRQMLRGWLDGIGAKHPDEIDTTWARHHVGTTRMGDDPEHAVCDRHGRVHATQNLFLSGCETFPTGGGLPPTLTACALTFRLTEHLDRWLDGHAESTAETRQTTAA